MITIKRFFKTTVVAAVIFGLLLVYGLQPIVASLDRAQAAESSDPGEEETLPEEEPVAGETDDTTKPADDDNLAEPASEDDDTDVTVDEPLPLEPAAA